MIAPTLVALALLAAGDPGDAAAVTPAPLVERVRTPRSGPRHAVALGWQGTTFFSERGSHYTFHSASLGYLGSFGSSGVFVHASGLLALQARQDGRVYATGDYYSRRTGGDLLVGHQWRWTALDGAEVEVGPGLHASVLWLPGKVGYRDFSALQLGVGAASTVRWRTGARVFSRPLAIGPYGSVAYDFHDPLRADDLARGFAFRLGLLAGVGGR